jgi:hypothetical protein
MLLQALAPGARAALLAVVVLAVTGCAPSAAVTAPAGPTPTTAEEQLLPVRYDASSGRVLLTVPRLEEEMLYLGTLASGLGTTATWLDRGEVGTDAVVRFERHGNRVFLMRQNTAHRAVGGDPALRRSVEESFPRSVLASFAIQSEAGGALTVDATDFFLGDVYGVLERLRAAGLGTARVDRERSYIDGAGTRSFADNTEVRSVLSFVADAPHIELRRVAPDGRSFTLQQHHSFVRLPAEPLPIRAFDPRAGLFAATYFDFAQALEGDYRQRGVVRWRLEPRDTAAYLRGELVEPVRPIVYYLDPAIPEPYRGAFVEGGLWWNEVFEAAGWRNAFRIEPLPAGADPMDARYPMIYWVHRQQRGPSVGPSFRDPRTGEIVGTVVRMDSYRSLVNHDIYMGLLPAAGPGGLQLTAEEFAMARRRQHSAHEIGHTLGLAHNFLAATQGRSSVMDYPYPLITLDERGAVDVSAAYRPSGGAHDTLAVRYAYTWFPTPEAEAAGLRAIVREAEAAGLRFIGDVHAQQGGSYPAASHWVEGADMLQALERTVAVRRVLLERFDQRAAVPGEPLAVLNRRLAHVYLHHRYALHGVIKAVGGMEFGYALAGEATLPTRILPAAEQRRALRAVVASLSPAELRVPGRLAGIIPPVPPGFDGDLTLIPTPAGTAFDPLYAAHALAQEIADLLLHPQRAARLVSFAAADPAQLSLSEVLRTLLDVTWAAPAGGGAVAGDAALRRVAQRAVLDAMLDLAGDERATAEVRAVTEHHLAGLLERVQRPGRGGPEEEGHRAAARRDLVRYFDGRDDAAERPRPAPIPLPWP